ncbi:hypothetical protein BH18ACT10_BH18ACT10_00180 [soil metagenome]
MSGDTRISSRSYEGNRDLKLLRDFLSTLTADGQPQSCWHPGDITWTLFQNTHFDPHENVRLWEDEAGLVGFAVLEEPDGVVTKVRPAPRGVLEEKILRWASGKLAEAQRAILGLGSGPAPWMATRNTWRFWKGSASTKTKTMQSRCTGVSTFPSPIRLHPKVGRYDPWAAKMNGRGGWNYIGRCGLRPA